MDPLGSEDYREGSLLRLKEAQTLSDNAHWVGAIYLAGRAVEAIFRSLLRQQSKKLETGHDLKQMLTRARFLMSLSETEDDKLNEAVNEVATVWRNDLRFAGEKRVRRQLKASGRMHNIGQKRVKGDPLKANAKSVLEACERIVTIGEPICQRYRSLSRIS